MPDSPNGGTQEYQNIIDGINNVDVKILEQQMLLQDEFSKKLDISDTNPISEGNNILEAAALPLAGAAVFALPQLGSQASAAFPTTAGAFVRGYQALQAGLINTTGVVTTTLNSTKAVASAASAANIAKGGIGGLVSMGKSVLMLGGKLLGIVGNGISLIYTVWEVLSTIGQFVAASLERIIALEVDLGGEKHKIKRLQRRMSAMEARMNAMEETMKKLPDQVALKIERPGGMLDEVRTTSGSTFESVKTNFGKLFKFLPLGQIFSALSLIVSLHNAAMLSNNLVQTLGSVIDVGLDVMGLKSPEGESFNISEILGKKASELMKSILGEATWNNTVSTFNRANRVYQSGMNIVNSVQSMVDSVRNIMELGAENTGKIGNALKKAGVVFENAYNWMPENINSATSKQVALNRVTNTIRSLDDTASSTESVLSEVKSIQDVKKEIDDQREEWKKAVNELQTTKTTVETSSKLVSESAIVTKTNLAKPVSEP